MAFMVVVYPCLVLAYMGEAAYLSQNRLDLQSSFFSAIPGKTYYFYETETITAGFLNLLLF